jgi:hypothetical protein
MPKGSNLTQEQERICTRFGSVHEPPDPEAKVGIALQTLGRWPLNALRQPAVGDTCGWYLWAGDISEDPAFFQPLHVKHLEVRCPAIVPYLALTAGWRVQLAPGHEDVWNDDALLDV